MLKTTLEQLDGTGRNPGAGQWLQAGIIVVLLALCIRAVGECVST